MASHNRHRLYQKDTDLTLRQTAFLVRWILTLVFCPACFSAETVTVDLTQPLMISSFQIGTTHTQYGWEFGNATAVTRAKNLLIDGKINFQNQHIMGWYALNPEPSPGVYNWSSLDHRINDVITAMSPDITGVITFCTAPGWMKTKGSDWDMEDRVADAYVADFADLCKKVAQRYPNVRYFQVWNELKGYWNISLNNWDYTRYTTMYNAVYASVKSVRPDAKLGGAYIVIQGDGGVTLGKSGTDTYAPIRSRDWTVINYWLANKHGADFLCIDYKLIDGHDTNTYTKAEKMQLTHFFGDVVAQIKAVEPTLPIWFSEFYGGMDTYSTSQFTAANHASCYYHSLINGAALALQWNPEEGEILNPLFTDTSVSTGGQPTPHYNVVYAFNNYFGPGTQIYKTTTSTPDVEALASLNKTMLINKSSSAVTVTFDHNDITLNAYEVRILNTRTGIFNFEDFAVFCSYYFSGNSCPAPDYCAGFDYNTSGSVDMLDMFAFASSWLDTVN